MKSYNQFRETEIERPPKKELAPDDFSNVFEDTISEAPTARSVYNALPGDTAFDKADNIVDLSGKVLTRAEAGMGIFNRFKNLFVGLIGRGGAKHVDRLGQIEDAAKAQETQKRMVAELAKRIETGVVKLKSTEDIIKFRDIAAMSDIYRNDGSVGGEGRDTARKIGKHIDIVIAKNLVSQVTDRDQSMFLLQFMDMVDSNDFCAYS